MSSLPQVLRRLTVSTILALLTVSTVTASEFIEYEYDALGRLSKACYVLQTKLVTYSYDAAGNRTSVTTSTVACGNATFTVEDAPQTEVGSQMSFTVRRLGATGATNAVNFATANGTAVAGTHYTATNGTLTFSSGQAVKTVPVNTIAGSIAPGGANKALYLNLSNPTQGAEIADPQGSGTLANTSPVVPTTFTIANAPAAEVGSPLSFTVTRSGPTSATHAVNFATANGTAVAGTHYTTTSGTLTFTSGQTVKTVPVSTIAGSIAPGGSSKTLYVNLTSPTGGAEITGSQGSGTIVNTSSPAYFTIANASQTEVGSQMSFTVTRSGPTSSTQAVNFATANGTAVAGTHYTTTSGTLTFTSGQTVKTVPVSTIAGSIVPGGASKTLYVNLSNPTGGAELGGSQGSGTIVNTGPPTYITIANAPETEVGSQMSFTVTRSGATSSTHAVNFVTANGTAVAGTHYTTTSGTLTFTSGQTTKTVPVSTIAGSIAPGGASKTLYVNLTSPTGGALISSAQGSGTIVNTSPAATFAIANAGPVRVGSQLSFTVTRSGPTGTTQAVSYATANGTATAGTHYTTTSGTLTFTSGQTVKTVPVNTIAGSIPTGGASKTFNVNLTNATNGAQISTAQGTGTIKSNTAPVAVNDTHHGHYYVMDSVPVYVRANDYDVDGDSLTITNASCASSGCLVSIVNGTHLMVMATTNSNWKIINYTISDGHGGTASATATVSEFFALDPDCGEFWC